MGIINLVNHFIPEYKDLAGLFLSLISICIAFFTFLVAFVVYLGAKNWVRGYFDRNKLSSAASIRSDLFKIRSLVREFDGCRTLSSNIINVTNGQLQAIRSIGSHAQLNENKIYIFNCFNPTINLVSELKRNLSDVSNSINHAMLGIKDGVSKSHDYVSLVRKIEEVNVSLSAINKNLSEVLVELMTAQSNVLIYDAQRSIENIINQNSKSSAEIYKKFGVISDESSGNLDRTIEKILNIKMINIM